MCTICAKLDSTLPFLHLGNGYAIVKESAVGDPIRLRAFPTAHVSNFEECGIAETNGMFVHLHHLALGYGLSNYRVVLDIDTKDPQGHLSLKLGVPRPKRLP